MCYGKLIKGFSKSGTRSDLHLSKVALIAVWEIGCQVVISGKKPRERILAIVQMRETERLNQGSERGKQTVEAEFKDILKV